MPVSDGVLERERGLSRPAARCGAAARGREHMTDVIVYDIFSPPQAARAYAYASVAAYEALRHDDSTYRSLAGQLNGLTAIPMPRPDSEYYFPLAGVHEFLTVGKSLTFSQKRMDSLRTAMHAR